MGHKEDLSEIEKEMLRRVARGEFTNVATVPASLNNLVSIGLVQVAPALVFPIVPQRNNYSLTDHGKKVIDLL